MAKDSVFNATSVLRALAGIDTADFDLHINVVGGGNIDGPSAGLAIFLALYSAITKTPMPQDVAITGELSIQGKGARRRRRGRETLRGTSGRHARVAVAEGKRARGRRDRSPGIDVVPVAERRSACCENCICTGGPQGVHRLARRRARTTSVSAQPLPSPLDRIPPHNLEAEMAVLGSILVDKAMMAEVGQLVKPSDFYAHVHETIFSVLVFLFEHDEPIDKITVSEELRNRDALERVGGSPYHRAP